MQPLKWFIQVNNTYDSGLSYYKNVESMLKVSDNSFTRLLIERQLATTPCPVEKEWYRKIFKLIFSHFLKNPPFEYSKEEDLLLARLISIINPIHLKSEKLFSKIKRVISYCFGKNQKKLNVFNVFYELINIEIPLPFTYSILLKRLKISNLINVPVNDKKESLLFIAAKQSNLLAAKLLIENGADINQINCCHRSPLILASMHGLEDMAIFLMDNGADLEIKDKFGWPAFFYAAIYGYVELLKYFIKLEADLTIEDNDGFSILDNVKLDHSENYFEIISLIKKAFPQLIGKSKELILRKGVGQAWHLSGTTIISSKVKKHATAIKISGGCAHCWLNRMAKDLFNLPYYFPNLLTSRQFSLLWNVLKFAADQKNYDALSILKRIHQGQPTMLETGFDMHSVMLFIWNNRLALCNRGASSRWPVEIFHYKKENLSVELIEKITSLRNEEKYQKYFFSILPKRLGFTKTKEDFCLQSASNLPMQTVGNCSWISSVTAVYSFFMFLKKPDKRFDKNRVLKKLTIQKDIYQKWLAFQQITLLERLFDNARENSEFHPDCHLLTESLIKAHSFRLDPINHKRLTRITANYIKSLEEHEQAEVIKNIPRKKQINL